MTQMQQQWNWMNYGSFFFKKTNTSWIWIALCCKTRQVIARAVGDRSKDTRLILWNNIPEAYRSGQCFSDFWSAYQAIIHSASNVPK
jgi:insertion element IS1 protein InsB